MRGEGFAPSSRSFPAKGAAPLAIPAQPPERLPIDAECVTRMSGARCGMPIGVSFVSTKSGARCGMPVGVAFVSEEGEACFGEVLGRGRLVRGGGG
jgi:hypothetical protein